MIEQRTKGYVYLTVGALLLGIVVPSVIKLTIFMLGAILVGYGALLAYSSMPHGRR